MGVVMAGRGNVSRRWRVLVATLVTVFGLSGSLFATPPASAAVIRVFSQTFLSVDTPGTTTHRAGETLNLTAHVVTIGTASGTVFFRAGAAVIGSGLLVDGTARLRWDADRIGTLALTASYSGSTATMPSKSVASSWLVQKAPTQIPLGYFGIIEGNNVVAGQPVNIVAIVLGAILADNATGKVVFRDGTRVLGAVLARDPNYYFMAHLVVSNLVPHTMSLTASYTGSKLLAPSTSEVQTVTVLPAPVVASLQVSNLNPTLGESVTMTQQMWPAGGSVTIPKGRVKFLSGTTVLGSKPLVNGVATLVTTRLPAGAVDVSSSYAGNVRTLGVMVPAATLPISVSLVADVNTVTAGYPVLLTAVPSPSGLMQGAPTGTVTFHDGGTVLGSAPIIGSAASVYVAFADAGSRRVTATYSGDGVYGPSVSNTLIETVDVATTFTPAFATPNPSHPGDAVTIGVSMMASSGIPTGLVEFYDGTTMIGSAVLSGIYASITTSALALGDHALSAKYLGDLSHQPSTSAVFHQIVRVPGGLLNAWGSNNVGQFGDGSTDDRTFPVDVDPTSNWQSLAFGYVFDANLFATNYSRTSSVGVKSDGTLWAWGSDQLAPARVGAASNWVSVSGRFSHFVARRTDGTLWGWGTNSSGQLGDGTGTDRATPVQVGTDADWLDASVGTGYSLGVKTDGTLWAWGLNDVGQLGIGVADTFSHQQPIRVGSGTDWVSAAAGASSSFALRSDGTLWAWGNNEDSQLGDGTATNRPAPIQVGADSNWASVSPGVYHVLGTRTDGTLWSWGELPLDATATEPQQVGTDTDWVSAAAGNQTSFGIRSGGTLWAWGDNFWGQLGDGTTNDRLVPTQVGSGSTWTTVVPGRSTTLALEE